MAQEAANYRSTLRWRAKSFAAAGFRRDVKNQSDRNIPWPVKVAAALPAFVPRMALMGVG